MKLSSKFKKTVAEAQVHTEMVMKDGHNKEIEGENTKIALKH